MNEIQSILEVLKKYDFSVKLKKCSFHKHEVRVLDYIILVYKVQMKEKRIEMLKNWPKKNQYKTFKFLLLLTIFINTSFKALIELLHYLY